MLKTVGYLIFLYYIYIYLYIIYFFWHFFNTVYWLIHFSKYYKKYTFISIWQSQLNFFFKSRFSRCLRPSQMLIKTHVMSCFMHANAHNYTALHLKFLRRLPEPDNWLVVRSESPKLYFTLSMKQINKPLKQIKHKQRWHGGLFLHVTACLAAPTERCFLIAVFAL